MQKKGEFLICSTIPQNELLVDLPFPLWKDFVPLHTKYTLLLEKNKKGGCGNEETLTDVSARMDVNTLA